MCIRDWNNNCIELFILLVDRFIDNEYKLLERILNVYWRKAYLTFTKIMAIIVVFKQSLSFTELYGLTIHLARYLYVG